jgi:hypothetical protein
MGPVVPRRCFPCTRFAVVRRDEEGPGQPVPRALLAARDVEVSAAAARPRIRDFRPWSSRRRRSRLEVWRCIDMTEYGSRPEDDARARAVASLKKKADFRTHLLVYLVVNGALVVIWAMTGAAFFWPVFPIVGWGIGVIFHANDVYGSHEISEEDIRREMERMK